MSRPQIILLPGAWHLPVCYDLIIPKLEAAGYTVHTTRLPSVTTGEPPADLSEDIETVQALVKKAIGSGNDVVVVPHSWSGVVAGSALVGYGKKERETNGEKGGVVRTGYMCSFMMPEGVSLMDGVKGTPANWWSLEDDKWAHLEDVAADVVYNDLTEAEREKWLKLCSRRQSLNSFKAKATGASWKEIPTSYLMCEDDQAIPIFVQEAMTGMVKEMGGDIEIQRLKSSHSPFLSHVDETVAWIRKVAGEEI